MGFFKKFGQFIVIVGLLAYIFLNRSCSDPIIPKGKEVVKYDTIYQPVPTPPKYITKYVTLQGKEILIPGRIDTVEVKTFETAHDTTQTQMYIDATRIRQYNEVFKDSLADVSIFAETKGELLKIAPTVTIKARLPEKKTTFAMYAGGGLYTPIKLDEIGYKLNLRFQNKKGDLFSISYDPVNKVVFAEYDIRFINIRK